MAQKLYFHEGKEYIQVRVFKRASNGRPMRFKTKFDSKGRRISSQQTAHRIEYELRKKLDSEAANANNWRWKQWHHECLRRMRLTLKENTAIAYDGGLKKWIPNDWQEKRVDEITRNEIFQLIFETIGENEKTNAYTKRAVLRKISRIFQMAVEEGIVNRNPAIGIRVKTPPSEKKVLNSTEANILLNAAKDCNHRFYYHWAVALFTGMRSGELYALRWTDVDLETGLISVTKQWTSKDGIHETKTNRNRVVPISPELKKNSLRA